MNARKIALKSALIIVGLLVAAIVTAAAFVYAMNRANRTMMSSSRSRQYLLYVPASYDRARPTPLVISMHAAALWPSAQMTTSRWNALADRYGFIVVYPAGGFGVLARAWPVDGETGRAAEVRFISDLIDTLAAGYNIDPTRIYANGLSNGGAMAFVLSCTLSDRIAAVGMVAAAQSVPWNWCTDRRPVPMILFHGTADPLVPYGGGRSWASRTLFPSVTAWTENWARRNRCGPQATASRVALDVTRLQYTNCAADAGVVLYTVHGGGHSWPGGAPMPQWIVGPTSNGVDATREMWIFFREHPLQKR